MAPPIAHRRNGFRFRRPADGRSWLFERLEGRALLAASLVADLNTRPLDSTPGLFRELNGALLFSAAAPGGRDLYTSDGTPAGTTLLADVAATLDTSRRESLQIGDTLYFAGAGNLWRTDGTAAGTMLVADINAVPLPSSPRELTNAGGTLYFVATTRAGDGLYKTDGTPGGTVLVRDAPQVNASFDIGEVATVGDDVYFTTQGFRDVPGRLWKSDGTMAGTAVVKEFPNFTTPAFLTVVTVPGVGGRLIFNAFSSDQGSELWVSDGTPGGTHVLKAINPGRADGNPGSFVHLNGVVYFTADDGVHGAELWRTDGTAEGTTIVADILPGPGGSSPAGFAVRDGVLFFDAYDGTRNGLWRSDGTVGGTTAVSPVRPANIVVSGDTLFFRSGNSLYRSDGTGDGTALVRTFSGLPLWLGPALGGVAFSADDGAHGAEPWFSNGTPAGTVMLADVDPRNAGSWPTSFGAVSPNGGPALNAPVSLGDRVLFPARDTAGTFGLYSTDGTPGGTTRIPTFTDFGVYGFKVVGDTAYVLAQGPGQIGSLWRTDGTAAGTTRLARVDLTSFGTVGGAVDSLAVLNGELYFAGDLPSDRRGFELMKTDGTAAGTVRVKDLNTTTLFGGSSTPHDFMTVGDVVYFTANEAGNGPNELWKTDGTAAGTVMVKAFDGHPGTAINAGFLTDVGGTLYFRAVSNNYSRYQVWKTDGTSEGTVMVKEFAQPPDFMHFPMRALDGRLYFAAAPLERPDDVELWTSDGTDAGTVVVADVNAGDAGAYPSSLTVFDGRLYFAATDPTGGSELWSTDGTAAGTRRVADVNRGPGGASPRVAGAAGGRLYFSGDDGTRGRELWSTDGTPADTDIVEDVAPGAAGSSPNYAVAAGPRIVFWADDGLRGVEPWAALPAPPVPFVAGRHVFYNNSRYDGRDAAANAQDDAAIATDKVALRPGEAATFANVTSFIRGINGVMVEVNTRYVAEYRLSFRVSTADPAAPWTAAPAPLETTRRNHGLPLDLERITVTWPDGAIRNCWLEVTVEATTDGVVTGTDVFYFGNLAGDTGDADAPLFRVNALDLAAVRRELNTSSDITGRFDFDRDGRVNALDLAAARQNLNRTLGQPVTPPITTAAIPPFSAAPVLPTRRVWDEQPADILG